MSGQAWNPSGGGDFVSQVIQVVRADPRVDTPEGWSCDAAAELLGQKLSGGTPMPVSVGEHVAYIYPASGSNMRILDITAIQFTSRNLHPLPIGIQAPRISWTTIIAEGLDEPINSGIFTKDQHDKLVRLIVQWRPF